LEISWTYIGSNDFTINAWIKADNYNQYAKIINKGQTSVGRPKDAGYSLRIVKPSMTDKKEEYELLFDVIDNNQKREHPNCPISKLKRGQFIMITGVLIKLEGKTYLKLFVDSELKSSRHFKNIGSIDTNIPLAIGALHRGVDGRTSEIFKGYIDDVRIYNRALSVKEIKKLYQTIYDK